MSENEDAGADDYINDAAAIMMMTRLITAATTMNPTNLTSTHMFALSLYDMYPFVCRKLDWISVNAFDLLNPRRRTLQHHTALYSSAKVPKQDRHLNVVRCCNGKLPLSLWSHEED